MKQESLTEKLAKHLMRPIDKATRQRARLHLLDWLSCVAGAISQKDRAIESEPNAVTKASLLANRLEIDDVHRQAILHPGPVIWPVALWTADELKVDLDSALQGAVAGYEATIAIGATFDAYHYARWHPTTTAGYFGAAATAATMMELDADQMANGLGNAGSVCGGLWQMRHEAVSTKAMHVAQAGFSGLWQARLARQGFAGPRFILEGPQGLYAATCKDPKPMEFPDQWRIHEVSFKPWGACRHAHPAIDAAMELKEKSGALDGDILVETYADALTFCDRPNPESVIDAKFSLQHAVAVVAEKGVPELADFEPEAIAKFADARNRVVVKEAPEITSRYPDHYGARISCAGESVELVDTLGDPERPMSKEQITDKARALIAWGGLPDKEADRAIELALEGKDAGAIHQMLSDWLS